MSEYRERTTGEVKTQGQWRADFANMSLPRVWKAATLDSLNLDAVLASPAATTTAYQTSVRDGVKQDANGNWVEKYVARDMFADTTEEDDDGNVTTTTKAQHEAAYQATLDAKTAEGHRTTRNKLLADTDWTQINDSPLSNEDKTAWATYRQELRGITDLDAWPNLADDDWPVEP
tara:strand:- start:579 stop:1103 length:525 start_codon:yes stop_codon:yes gene_type:complete